MYIMRVLLLIFSIILFSQCANPDNDHFEQEESSSQAVKNNSITKRPVNKTSIDATYWDAQ